MVAIVDYGVGNLFSLECSLNAIGAEVTVTADPEVLKSADQVLLPGVGAFGDAAEKLRSTGLDAVLKDLTAQGKPLLGICLGMQLLFEKGYEYGEHEGLGLIKGSVVPMEGVIPADLKIPHIGWNALKFKNPSPLFKNIQDGDCVLCPLLLRRQLRRKPHRHRRVRRGAHRRGCQQERLWLSVPPGKERRCGS